MRHNIAKASALIMVATTGMSATMTAATTVAWANETAAQESTEDLYPLDMDGFTQTVHDGQLIYDEAQASLEPEFQAHTEGNAVIDEDSRVEPTCSTDGRYDLVTYCTECGYEMSRETIVLNATGAHDWGDVYFEWPAEGSYFIEAYTDFNFGLHQHCMNCDTENEEIESAAVIRYTGRNTSNAYFYKNLDRLDGQLTDYWLEYHVEQSLYPCKPGVLEVTAYTKNENGENEAIEVRQYDYYESLYEYKHMSDHVDGETETYTDSDGNQHRITYCKKCGELIKDELILPEKKLGQVTGLKTALYGGNDIKLTWDALEGVDGYIIIGITYGANGVQLGYTANTSFIDHDVKINDYNYYWVIPYFKNEKGEIVKGELGKYVYAIGRSDIDVKAKTVENGVALTWNHVSNATGYIIKAKKASDKTATVIATIRYKDIYDYDKDDDDDNDDDTDTGMEYVDANASAEEYTFYWVFPCYTNKVGKTIVGAIDASKYVYAIAKVASH